MTELYKYRFDLMIVMATDTNPNNVQLASP